MCLSVCLYVCVGGGADGTHVWSVVAGWLEPEVTGVGWRGSEDNNIHIFTNAHTYSAINTQQGRSDAAMQLVRLQGGVGAIATWASFAFSDW